MNNKVNYKSTDFEIDRKYMKYNKNSKTATNGLWYWIGILTILGTIIALTFCASK